MYASIKQKPLLKDQVAIKVLDLISALKLQPGDRLASEKTLAEQFGVNHLTLRAAYTDLAERGILERRRSSGTFIKHLPGMVKENNELKLPASRTVVIAMRDDPHFFSELRNDVITEAQNRGFLPIAPGSAHNITFADMGVENLIIDHAELTWDPLNYAYLTSADCKYKNIIRVNGHHFDDERLPGCLISGDYAGAYAKAISYLKHNGHCNIAFFCGATTKDNDTWKNNKKIISYYTQAMIDNDLSEYISIITIPYDNICLNDSIISILECAKRPTAIFCSMDYRAVKVIDVAKEIGLTVPDDLSVIGFFDTPWSKHYGISSFRFRNKDIAKLVVDALENSRNIPDVNLFPIDFIERNSVSVAKEQAILSI